ncbi:MAG TPA: hypothetical protein PL157_20415, partial [Acidobacteriota bacterium]|nr:hypothetical protein [Acidobacteriota bacterium]
QLGALAVPTWCTRGTSQNCIFFEMNRLQVIFCARYFLDTLLNTFYTHMGVRGARFSAVLSQNGVCVFLFSFFKPVKT